MGVDRLSALDHGVPQDGPQGGLPAPAGADDDASHPLVQGLLQLQHLANLWMESGGRVGLGGSSKTRRQKTCGVQYSRVFVCLFFLDD